MALFPGWVANDQKVTSSHRRGCHHVLGFRAASDDSKAFSATSWGDIQFYSLTLSKTNTGNLKKWSFRLGMPMFSGKMIVLIQVNGCLYWHGTLPNFFWRNPPSKWIQLSGGLWNNSLSFKEFMVGVFRCLLYRRPNKNISRYPGCKVCLSSTSTRSRLASPSWLRRHFWGGGHPDPDPSFYWAPRNEGPKLYMPGTLNN